MTQITRLQAALRPHLPWHGARLTFLALFLVALFRVETVNLDKRSSVFANRAKPESSYKRLMRFLREFPVDFDDMARAMVSWSQIPQPWTSRPCFPLSKPEASTSNLPTSARQNASVNSSLSSPWASVGPCSPDSGTISMIRLPSNLMDAGPRVCSATAVTFFAVPAVTCLYGLPSSTRRFNFCPRTEPHSPNPPHTVHPPQAAENLKTPTRGGIALTHESVLGTAIVGHGEAPQDTGLGFLVGRMVVVPTLGN